jgi:hypothetical protein
MFWLILKILPVPVALFKGPVLAILTPQKNHPVACDRKKIIPSPAFGNRKLPVIVKNNTVSKAAFCDRDKSLPKPLFRDLYVNLGRF